MHTCPFIEVNTFGPSVGRFQVIFSHFISIATLWIHSRTRLDRLGSAARIVRAVAPCVAVDIQIVIIVSDQDVLKTCLL